MISYKHRFLFIHIPKVAGMSVNAALEPCMTTPVERAAHRVYWRLGKGLGWVIRTPLNHFRASRNFLHQYCTKRLFLRWPLNKLPVHPTHLKARDWQKTLQPEVYRSLFKFAFVRNPWDWQVSLYHYCLQDEKHPDYAFFRSLGSFERFIDWRVNEAMERQMEFVADERGDYIVDFIGRLENLRNDLELVCRAIGFQDVKLPHVNASVHKDYRSYYNDRTRQLVEEHFQEDIAAFGYTFDPRKTPWAEPVLKPSDVPWGSKTRPAAWNEHRRAA